MYVNLCIVTIGDSPGLVNRANLHRMPGRLKSKNQKELRMPGTIPVLPGVPGSRKIPVAKFRRFRPAKSGKFELNLRKKLEKIKYRNLINNFLFKN